MGRGFRPRLLCGCAAAAPVRVLPVVALLPRPGCVILGLLLGRRAPRGARACTPSLSGLCTRCSPFCPQVVRFPASLQHPYASQESPLPSPPPPPPFSPYPLSQHCGWESSCTPSLPIAHGSGSVAALSPVSPQSGVQRVSDQAQASGALCRLLHWLLWATSPGSRSPFCPLGLSLRSPEHGPPSPACLP